MDACVSLWIERREVADTRLPTDFFFTFELVIWGIQVLKFYSAKITLSHITLNDLMLKVKL